MSKHAATTRVPVAQTRSEIDGLLRKWKCDAVRWTDLWNQGKTVLEFEWTPDGHESPISCRFDILAGDLAQQDEAQEWRRIHRVLRVFLMGVFEAVDGGLISLEEAMLPWILRPNGQTVAQSLLPQLRELPTGAAFKLLEA